VNSSFRFLLDTNIVSQLIREPQGIVASHIERVGEERVCINVVVAAELRFGARKRRSSRLTRQVNKILGAFEILPLETPVEEHYAEIRDFLERKGEPIGANDLFIAAHARALGLTLVTENRREFSRVPSLKVANGILPT
jgi:tRNA(fMet)-specific endonuclease VapC